MKHTRSPANKSHTQQWIKNHLAALKGALDTLMKKPLSNLMTLLVIGVTLALPSALYLFVQQTQIVTEQFQKNSSLSLYLKQGTPEFKIQALMQQLKKNPAFSKITYVSADAGLAAFKEATHLGDVLEALDQNPLPPVIELSINTRSLATHRINTINQALAHNPIIDTVKLDENWLNRLYHIVTLAKRIVFALSTLFGLAIFLIIGNTIRLTMEQHHDEMTLLSLIGATPLFIQRPFIYRGCLYGCLGGLMSWCLLGITFLWIRQPALALAHSYQYNGLSSGLPVSLIFSTIGISTGIGFLSALLATRAHLKQTQI